MSDNGELRSLLKRIPFIQKSFLVMLTEASERKENNDELFRSEQFRQMLASNLFYVLTSCSVRRTESKTDMDNIDFLSGYVWAQIDSVPSCILVSVVLSNIEFKYEVDLSDFHRAFGRTLFAKKRAESQMLVFGNPNGTVS